MLNISSSHSIVSYHHWSTDKFIRIFILSIITCITLIGNMYIIFELFCRRCLRRTRLHLFLLNLAVGDLAICFCTMTSELFLLIYDQEWILGNVACKLTLYIQVVTIASTTFINVAMTYDRYEAVCCPFRMFKSFGRVRRIIIICWLSSFIVAIPQLFIFKQSLYPGSFTKYRCASTGYTAEWQRRVYFTLFASYVLVIPVVCMTVWFIRIIRMIVISTKLWTQNIQGQTTTISSGFYTSPTKVKTVKLAMTIIIVFVVCWTPYMVITLIEIYSNGHFRIPLWCDGVLQIICLIQSSLNPFIYKAFNQKQKYSSTLILAAASIYSPKSDRNKPRHRRERDDLISFDPTAETAFRKSTTNYTNEKSRKKFFLQKDVR